MKNNKIIFETIAYILIPIIFAIDFNITEPLSLSLIYLVSIAIITWYRRRTAGIIISCICAILWLIADLNSGLYIPNSPILYFNTLLRLGFFVLLTIILSMLKETLERERSHSQTDFLTEVNTIRNFYNLANNEIQRSLRYKHKLTILYLDLDNFKSVNDKFGHLEGNRLLKEIGTAMKRNLRSTDIIGRLGGDEFSIIIPETDYKKSDEVIQKLQIQLLKLMDENKWPVTFSIGAVTFSSPPATVEEIIHHSDDLMYSIKKAGKNAIKHIEK